MNRRLALVFGGAIGIVAIAFAVRSGVTSTATSADAGEALGIGRWPVGVRCTYDLHFTTDDEVTAAGQTFTSSTDIQGELELSALAKHGDILLLGARMPRRDKHVVRWMGHDTERDVLEGVDAWVEIGPEGGVRRISFQRAASHLGKGIFQAILAEIGHTKPVGEAVKWSATEPMKLGVADVEYSREPGSLTFMRRRVRYPNVPALADRGLVTLLPDGPLEALDDDETAEAAGRLRSHTVLMMRLRERSMFAASTDYVLDEALESRGPGEAVAPKDAEKEILAQRISGLTAEGLEVGVGAYDEGIPLEDGFMDRAAALVRSDSTLPAKLEALFQTAGVKGHALVLDLLASAGTKEAQASMRAALDSAVAKSDVDYPLLLQRLSLVAQPDLETADFVSRLHRESHDPKVIAATAVALGNVAHGLARQGKEAEARAYALTLRSELDSAKTTDDKIRSIAALGAVGRTEDVPTIVKESKSVESRVRAEAADALRHTKAPEARKALLELVGDSASGVSASALIALDQSGASKEEVASVATTVTAGSTDATNDGAMVSFLAKHANDADVKPALEVLLARTEDPKEKARIRYVIHQLSR